MSFLFGRTNGNYNGSIISSNEPVLIFFLRLIDAFAGSLFFIGLIIFFKIDAAHYTETALLIFIVSLFVFHFIGIYRSFRFSSMRQEIYSVVHAFFLLYTVLFFTGYILGILKEFSGNIIGIWIIAWPAFMILTRVLMRIMLRKLRRKGFNLRHAVIAGSGKVGLMLAHHIKANPWSGTDLAGFFDDNQTEKIDGFPVIGRLSDLPSYVRKHRIDIVYIALSMKAEPEIRFLLKGLSDTTASVHYIPSIFFLDLILRGEIIYFDNFPVIELRGSPIRGIGSLSKRIIDIVLSGIILIALFPVYIAVAVGVKLSSPGPVIYKQVRYGLGGEKIIVYKFRTMYVCENDHEFIQAIRDDPRVTPFGAFLRRTSIDELPQLINVVQGRMSLVGPRPHPVALNEEFRKIVPGYMLRHKVKPGITGLAQLKGYRGETDTKEKMEKRIEYDLRYLREWTVLLDLEILLRTLFVLLFHKDVY